MADSYTPLSRLDFYFDDLGRDKLGKIRSSPGPSRSRALCSLVQHWPAGWRSVRSCRRIASAGPLEAFSAVRNPMGRATECDPAAWIREPSRTIANLANCEPARSANGSALHREPSSKLAATVLVASVRAPLGPSLAATAAHAPWPPGPAK